MTLIEIANLLSNVGMPGVLGYAVYTLWTKLGMLEKEVARLNESRLVDLKEILKQDD
jgi:hypothetical protein